MSYLANISTNNFCLKKFSKALLFWAKLNDLYRPIYSGHPVHIVTHTLWPTHYDPHIVTHTLWPTHCDPHIVTHKLWPTHSDSDRMETHIGKRPSHYKHSYKGMRILECTICRQSIKAYIHIESTQQIKHTTSPCREIYLFHSQSGNFQALRCCIFRPILQCLPSVPSLSSTCTA